MLDRDLAEIYGVITSRINQQVRRNIERFPPDFVFLLSAQEVSGLILQIATSKGRAAHRKLPCAFTEHGATMAATVLNSPRAVKTSLFVVRVFVSIREVLSAQRELTNKLKEIERHLTIHDVAIREIVDAINRLTALPPDSEPKRRNPGSDSASGRCPPPVGVAVPAYDRRSALRAV